VTANASPSGVQARIYFYAISFQSVNSNACGSIAPPIGGNLLFFLIDEMMKHFYKLKPWALKTVAAAASSFII
jgi:hypothetical protein